MEPLVWAVDTSPVARSDTSTVEHVLNGQVDIDALALACDLDAIAESGDRSVSPAGAAVLWNVLVQGFGAVVDAFVVAPGEVGREHVVGDGLMGQRRGGGVSTVHEASSLSLLLSHTDC